MKKILAAIAITVLASSSAFAATSIAVSKHNLSSTGSGITSDTSQICAFCHTPHNAAPNVPLWNRAASGSTYMLYTSSATLTSATKASTLSATSISLLCLSCHDGTLAELGSRVVNAPSDIGVAPTMTESTAGTLWATNGANLGADLTNDHPIGFNYVTAQGEDAGIRTKAVAEGNGMKLFGAGADQMECASCHLVHDNTYAPFLRTTISGSALCLGCHIK